MEQDEDYKHLVATVQELEMKINILTGDALEQARAKAKKEIDLQFENFIKALEAKKEALYHEVDTKFQSLTHIHETQHQQAKAIHTEAKRSMSAGSLVYGQHPKLAAAVWKKAVTGAHDTINSIDVTFPPIPPGLIENYGSAVTTSILPSQYPVLSQQSLDKIQSATNSSTQEIDQRLKILIIGDSQVGKTCMLHQFVDNSFTLNSLATIGADFKLTTINLNGKQVKLQIWDMSGKERYRALAPGFFRASDGVMITFDLTERNTLASVKGWLADVEAYAPSATKLIVGNKRDIEDSRAVEFEVGKKLAEQAGLLYAETSATDNRSVRDAFHLLIGKVVQTIELQNSAGKSAAQPTKKDDCIVS